MNHQQEMEATLEAILFVSSVPISRERLLAIFPEEQGEQAAKALQAVVDRYEEQPGRGVVLEEVAGGLRIVSRTEVHGALAAFFETENRRKLSMAALETLAIIAYRQPVTSPEIQQLRGVNSAGVIKKLLENRLVRITGRKTVVGKPFLYGTTKEFVLHFGLGSLEDLPPLEEFEDEIAADSAYPEIGLDHEEAFLRQAAEIEENIEDNDE